ncbi:hypothetical protein ACFSGX_00055 [Sphingomonas arantia]|uniref:GNAT family N-acetyltransferase n=1 Tax=Sphingomonas arantia TaxID=1460676 RepID=A0ABW4TRQ1_9SPHN
MPDVTIRRVEPGDVEAVLALIVALAVYEREPDAVRATVASLRETLFGEGA